MINIAYINDDECTVTGEEVWQYDYGQKVTITGLPSLPTEDTTQVHFATNKTGGTAYAVEAEVQGSDVVADVPDLILRSGVGVVWLFVFVCNADEGETVYRVHFPVIRRPKPNIYREDKAYEHMFARTIAKVTAAAQTAAENASAANLAPAYDSTATYAKDDFCVSGGKLYQCNADISTAEAFNPAHWTEVKVTEVMGGGGGVTPEIMAQIENAQWKSESSEELFSETVTTVMGDFGVIAKLSYSNQLTADTLKVTFDGVEYTCPKIAVDVDINAYGGIGASGTDFTEFPFAILSTYNGEGATNEIYTPSAGTHTVSAVGDATVYTGEFQKAVKSLSGWKKVSSPQDADIVVLNLPHSIKLNVRRIVFSASDPTAITSTDGTTSIEPITIFYRTEYDLFENGEYTLSGLSSSPIAPSLYFKGSIQQTAKGVTIICGIGSTTVDESNLTYYASGLSNLIYGNN